ncbi:monothiol glutaredoxin-4 [Neoconidiobolus thromboides FSU 785]|nr:monothiol glutaredoxin-4 [Neoconidiobolus thromboides FSU 785]
MASTTTKLIEITNEETFEQIIQGEENKNKILIFYFWASWADGCKDMEQVLVTLAELYPQLCYYKIEAEELPDVSESFDIDSVPSFVFIKGGKLLQTIMGANAIELTETVEKYIQLIGSKVKPRVETSKEDINERLEKLVNLDKVMIFIKGSPEAPKCGFSRQLINILKEQGVRYQHFDILKDDQVRQGLKKYSNWPTYPQFYVNGELMGGLDIIKEMIDMEEFIDSIPKENRI